MQGTPFGDYRLIELLGRGGMGEVWRAFDTATNRIVAIKLLPPQFAHDTRSCGGSAGKRGAAQLNNPHVIPIHRYGEIDAGSMSTCGSSRAATYRRCWPTDRSIPGGRCGSSNRWPRRCARHTRSG